jgi:hypothetical protein
VHIEKSFHKIVEMQKDLEKILLLWDLHPAQTLVVPSHPGRLAVRTLALITICLFLLGGCASHGTWSKSDRGAWVNLNELIGSHEQTYYLKQWGEPVSRHEVKGSDGRNVTTDGEELLWLWNAAGTGPSEQSGQGWEIYLFFGNDKQRSFRNWRIDGYRSTLTVPDVIATTRKFEYRFGQELLGELGLLNEQHGIATNRYDYPSANQLTREIDSVKEQYGGGSNWRGWVIKRLQETVRVIAEATFRADNAARNLHSRLATDIEVIGWLEEQAEATNRSRPHQLRSQGSANSGIQHSGQAGLLGRGFLGPYTPNAYGPGMNADATGRPFIWQPQRGGTGFPDPTLQVKPDAYGQGVGMDQYGRPVRPACPPGWAGPC